METSPLTVCGSAFVTVFVLLCVLAAVIRLLTVVFPSRDVSDDAALVAAVTSAAATIYPGARVTRIEEEL